MFYYAVANGRTKGIFDTWKECEQQVKGYSNAKYKKFSTKFEAEQFIRNYNSSIKSSPLTVKTAIEKSSTENKLHQIAKKSKKSDFINDIRRNHLGDPIVYTDGACVNNGKSNAKAGIGIFWSINNPNNISRRLDGRQTNNRAEIEAAIVAIEIARKNNYETLDIHTDSKFMIQSMNEWLPKWKKNNWKLSNGNDDVKNKNDFQRLDEQINQLKRLIWTKVRGHSDDYGNYMADKLATNSIK